MLWIGQMNNSSNLLDILLIVLNFDGDECIFLPKHQNEFNTCSQKMNAIENSNDLLFVRFSFFYYISEEMILQ